MSTSQGKPPSSSRRPWTAEEDSLLGTRSDRALARKFGRTVKAVKNRRRLKGVFLVKEWRPEDDKILGTRPDRQVALLLGRLRENVAWRRRKLGIPCCYENRPWKPEELELLGRKRDEEVATLTGHPLFAVKVKRRELGRPKADPVLSCWTPEQDRLLGTMPDDEVARRVRRTRMAVQKRRFRLRIECQRPERPHWTEEELALLGTLPDAVLAQRLQCSVRRVAYKRNSLHIPHCPVGRTVRTEGDSPSCSALRTVNTPSSSPGIPPDYISIPEHLKSTPVGGPALPGRLSYLLKYTRIRLLGDLDGKRLSDFEGYPRCGDRTLWALKYMVFRALHPGVEPDLSAWPIPTGWYKLQQAIEVPEAIRPLSLRDLPLSSRLEGALKTMGIEQLGQLHGLPIYELQAKANCGAKTLAELKALLRRAEAGAFTLAEQELASRTPADLLCQIDDLVSRLPEQDRAFLTLRFGATGQAPQTDRQIGQQHGLTKAAVGLRLTGIVRSMRRQGSLKLRTLLEYIDSVCASSKAPLSPALVSTWQDPARPFRYSPQFYVCLIAQLRPDAGVFRAKRA